MQAMATQQRPRRKQSPLQMMSGMLRVAGKLRVTLVVLRGLQKRRVKSMPGLAPEQPLAAMSTQVLAHCGV
jgi:hypothetical protein